MSQVELVVSVNVRNNEGRVKFLSDIRITFGNRLVAMATLGGKYDNPSVLRELKNCPQRFKKGPAWDFAKEAKLI